MLKAAIDAHAHVFRRGLPLAADRRYAPDYDASVELYLETLDHHGLTHGVLVQPSFLGTDNSFLVASLPKGGGRLRGIAVVDPAIGRDALRRLDEAGIVGARLNLIGHPVPDFASGPWPSFLEEIQRLGWHIEIQREATGLAAIAPRLVEAGLQVVLDHFGLPDALAGPADPGFEALLRLGATRDVWVKVSGAYRCGPDGAARRLFPPLRDAFGLDRLMWGSDWPHTRFEDTQSYAQSRAFLSTLVGDESAVAAMLASPHDLFRF